jgi:hypothetical protein
MFASFGRVGRGARFNVLYYNPQTRVSDPCRVPHPCGLCKGGSSGWESSADRHGLFETL